MDGPVRPSEVRGRRPPSQLTVTSAQTHVEAMTLSPTAQHPFFTALSTMSGVECNEGTGGEDLDAAGAWLSPGSKAQPGLAQVPLIYHQP